MFNNKNGTNCSICFGVFGVLSLFLNLKKSEFMMTPCFGGFCLASCKVDI